MHIKCKYLREKVSPAISLVIANRLSKNRNRSSCRNLNELNECLLVGGSGKQEK